MSGPKPNKPSKYAFKKHCNKCKKPFFIKDLCKPKFTYCRKCNRILSLKKYYEMKKDRPRHLHFQELQRKRYHESDWVRKAWIRLNANSRRDKIEGRVSLDDCRKIVKRDTACVYCNSKEFLTFDHVRPKNVGGKNIFENLVLACYSCNIKKSASDAIDWCLFRLGRVPSIIKKMYTLNYPEKVVGCV